MTHINRNKIAYRNCQRKVLSQENNNYTIKYKKELLILKVDGFSGSVAIV